MRLSSLQERVTAKVRHAAPASDTFSESYRREEAAEWGALAEELRKEGWDVEVGALHPLYGEGTVTIRKRP